MVLVDSSAWIEFFGGKDSRPVRSIEGLIDRNESLCICGIVLTEVLQGIRSDSAFRKTRDHFEDLVYLPMSQETFHQAAIIYRSLRKRGITVRKSVDCMIAAVAIEFDIPLLHADRDFEPIQKHCGLRVVG
ncbi:MAG: PIN domain nuclease [Candidatus Omnitrophica bacterium]|nr:PIN domain nuclease [Candidatus Omnitrophota bacterium]